MIVLINVIKKIAVMVLTLLLSISLCACAFQPHDTIDVIPSTRITVIPTISISTSTPVIEPTPTSATTKTASIGVVGDIMIMSNQVSAAHNSNTDTYDFTRSFEPMRKIFNSVDFMCGNLETVLAGKSAIYSQPAPTQIPPTAANPNPPMIFQGFNAPDELAKNLRGLGFDLLTTANNHCLDRGVDGLRRTIKVIRDAGLYQTGTFQSGSDVTPLIVGINGIKVGFVAFSGGFNTAERKLTGDDKHTISRLYDTNFVKSQLAALKTSGAEYIIAFPHCGDEYETEPLPRIRNLFEDMVSWGADAIIASHPHVVQPMEWIDIERNGSTIHAPIVYSLGNFIANMSPSPKDYELYVRLDIEKSADGVIATKLAYLPVYCLKQYTKAGLIHQTLPCFENTSRINAYEPISANDMKNLVAARKFVINICSEEFLMSDDDM